MERQHAEAIAHVVNQSAGDYATKADLTALGARLEATVGGFEATVGGLEATVGGLESKIVAVIDAKVEQAKNVILRSIVAASVAIIVTLLGGIFAIISAV